MSRRSCTLRAATLPVVAALLVAAVLVGMQWLHIGRAHATTAQNGASARSGDDWAHAQQVVAALKAKPPKVPVVYLLGGSAARECTISDASWAAQVKRLGWRKGPGIRGWGIRFRSRLRLRPRTRSR